MAGPEIKIIGVTFESVRLAITDLFFRHDKMDADNLEALISAMQYVVPMQHNFENPMNPGSQDTWIQYWIDEDDRIVSDTNLTNTNTVHKVATVTLRFLGRRAEVWAKSFHHLTKHKYCETIFSAYCNASLLPYVSPIVPRNIDYFGVGNTTKAFTLRFKLQYEEVLDYSAGSGGDALEYIAFSTGQVNWRSE